MGGIKPLFSKRFNAWVFKHPAYPDIEYHGDSAEEVIENYPIYLRQLIKEMLDRNISPLKRRGGKRMGAGRPKGTKKEPTMRISLPIDIAEYFERPESISEVMKLIAETGN